MTTLRRFFLSCLLLVMGCETTSSLSLPPSTTPADAGQLTRDDGGPTLDAGPLPSCDAPGPEVSLAELQDESIRRLNLLLGVNTGLDSGTLYFQEMVSNTEMAGGPAGDHTAIIYVPDAVPVERVPGAAFPPEGTYRPAVFWGLNGVSRVMFTDVTKLSTVGVDRRFPIGALMTFKAGTPEAEMNATITDLKTRFGADGASWSVLAGVLVFDVPSTAEESPTIDAVEARRYAQMLSAVTYLKGLANVASIELNGAVYPLPIRTWPAVQLAVSNVRFKPECLRGESRYFRDYPGAFTTLPSFAKPFGSGLTVKPKPPFDATCFPFGQVDKVCWEEKHRSGP